MALDIYQPPTFEKVSYEIPNELKAFVERYLAYVKEVHGMDTTLDRVLEMMCESVVDSSRKSMREFRTHLSKPETKNETSKTINKELPKPKPKIGAENIGAPKDR